MFVQAGGLLIAGLDPTGNGGVVAGFGDSSGGGGYPNLWAMPAERHAAFLEIVRGGAFADAGMASFADVLSEQDAKAIHAYLAKPLKPADTSNRKAIQ